MLSKYYELAISRILFHQGGDGHLSCTASGELSTNGRIARYTHKRRDASLQKTGDGPMILQPVGFTSLDGHPSKLWALTPLFSTLPKHKVLRQSSGSRIRSSGIVSVALSRGLLLVAVNDYRYSMLFGLSSLKTN